MFLFKQKTAYDLRISDWSSDVCSSYLSDTDGRNGPWVQTRRRRGPAYSPLNQHRSSRSPDRARGRTFPNLGVSLGNHRQIIRSSSCRQGDDGAILQWSMRSEERRVGQECVSTCRSRLSLSH